MAAEIVVSEDEYEVRAAILEDGSCVEIYIERKSEERTLGNIYKGRVGSVVPGIQAAFIDIGSSKNGFLSVRDLQTRVNEYGEKEENGDRNGRAGRSRAPIESVLKKGQDILVRVDRESIGAKGPHLTGHISIPGRHAVYMPTSSTLGVSRRIGNEKERSRLQKAISKHMPKTGGIILRTACAGCKEEEFVPEIKYLIKTWEQAVAKSKRKKAPALVYEDLGMVYRIIRDFLTDDVKRLVVEGAELHRDVMKFVEESLPSLREKIVYYDEAVPAFEKFGVEQEVKQATGQRVWLKSGGYLVIGRGGSAGGD